MNYLSIDIGTSTSKCQLFSDSGDILEYISEEYGLLELDGESYVDTEQIFASVRRMIAIIAKKHDIASVAVSSLGESFVLLDENDRILFHPMLYTDPRGDEEAKVLSALLGDERIFRITGTVPAGMYSVSKLMMIKKRFPELYGKAKKVMLIADYVGYLLTGERVIDYALAARTGAFDIEKLEFSEEILSPLGFSPALFSRPMRAGSIVAPLKAALASELGMKTPPLLVLGSHDQVCTTLGAGALSAGDAVDGLGTVECITVLFDKRIDALEMGKQGYPCVPFARDGLFCTYALNYSCGSLTSWYRKKIMHGYSGDCGSFFEYIEKDMTPEPTGMIALPYLGGAATPYQDINAKGALIGISLDTTDSDVYKALLEGTAMEMRLNADVLGEYGVTIFGAVATGGGANSDRWLAIKADIQGIPYRTLRSSEGGLSGCAMLQAVAMGSAPTLEAARDIFVRYGKEFLPNGKAHEKYADQYLKYKKTYKAVKEIYPR